ncbi:MAG: RNA polymerase sigma factor [Gemmatimonadetes bacterium]|nr:RNA polymerase sigma factor [Gemmatimonadota bacterium]
MDPPEPIEAAARGEPWAIRAVYDRHADRVWAVVRRIAGDDATAEDWAQEAWIKVFHALPSFRGEARISTWIHRIAVNVALDGRRRLSVRPIGDAEPLPDEGLAHPIDPGKMVDRIALERAIDRLPDGMREVLVLHDVEGYTHAEIGTSLGVAPGTSRSQLFKARAKLRAILAPAPRPAERRKEERCAT